MIQAEELINLILSTIFITYLIYLIRSQTKPFNTFWFMGICAIFLSQILTVLEGYLLPTFLNLAEHAAFCAGAIMILVSTLKKELR